LSDASAGNDNNHKSFPPFNPATQPTKASFQSAAAAPGTSDVFRVTVTEAMFEIRLPVALHPKLL
jgi:hypothetical protein